MARTAAIAGTATAVSSRVARRQEKRYAEGPEAAEASAGRPESSSDARSRVDAAGGSGLASVVDSAAEMVGFAEAHLRAYRVPVPSADWPHSQIDRSMAGIDPVARRETELVGAALDRRGFLNLVSQAEQEVDDKP
jgi:hypothetical protein